MRLERLESREKQRLIYESEMRTEATSLSLTFEGLMGKWKTVKVSEFDLKLSRSKSSEIWGVFDIIV